MKIIPVLSCRECPHSDHRGGFGQVAYLPVCRKANQEMPWEPVLNGTRVQAKQTVDIPDWCPLEER